MGLFSSLTGSKFGPAILKWQEPAEFRVRLRGDVLWRLLIALGVWFLSTTVFVLLFSINQNPPGLGSAFGLGLIGFGFAMMALFFRAGHVSGRFVLREDGLQWQATSAGVPAMRTQVVECEYDEIRRCTLFPDERIGHSFSVMLLRVGNEELLFGIPARVGYQEVGELMRESGVDVGLGRRLPAIHTQGIAAVGGWVTAGVGLAAVVIASLVFESGQGDGEGRRVVDRRANIPVAPRFEDLPQPQFPGENRQPPGGTPADPNPGKRPAVPSPFVPKRTEVPAAHPDGATKTVLTTEMVGGAGGVFFYQPAPNGQPAVGLACSVGSWAGRERVGQLQTLFDRNQPARFPHSAVAKPGYAIGGLLVQGETFVDAIALIFMRVKADGSMDPADQYTSEWLGSPGNDGTITRIDTEGKPVTGFKGRGGAILDAVGVLVGNAQR